MTSRLATGRCASPRGHGHHRLNELIELLPRKDRLSLLDACQRVPLDGADVLCERGSVVRHAYFPTEGCIVLAAQLDGRSGAVGIGMIGRESMLGAQIALGMATAPLRALVQGPGRAWRIGSGALRRELAGSVALRRQLNNGLTLLLSQLVTSAACLHLHVIGPRLARWLLMSHDRADGDRFHVTHEVLAAVLGVRRAGITLAAGSLQRRGLIGYRRGEVTVLDRSGLEAAACSCYAALDKPAAALCAL